jgi:hypothetical protein
MTNLDKETTEKIITAIEAKFREYHLFHEVFDNYCGLCIDITWGDWKHDHLCTKWIAEEVLDGMGYKGKYTITEQVTEEDGSDCYSATHIIRFH